MTEYVVQTHNLPKEQRKVRVIIDIQKPPQLPNVTAPRRDRQRLRPGPTDDLRLAPITNFPAISGNANVLPIVPTEVEPQRPIGVVDADPRLILFANVEDVAAKPIYR